MTKVQNHEEGWKGEKGQCNGHEPKSLVISQWIYLNIISYNIIRTIAIQNATFKLMRHLTSFVAC